MICVIRVLPRSLVIVVILTLLSWPGDVNGSEFGAAQAAPRGLTPTLSWVNFYSIDSTMDGNLLPAGSRITAYDPQGVECGEFVVDTPGQYGVMPVYGDDLTTPEDEGARPGDVISFRINGLPAKSLGPDDTRWTVTGDLKHVDLAIGQPAGEATPVPTLAAPVSPTLTPVATLATPSGPANPTPMASPTGPAATPASQTAVPGQTATPGGASLTPAAGAATTPAGSQTSPGPARPAGTAPAGNASTPNSPTPDALAILGLATSAPTSGARPGDTPGAANTAVSQPRLPVGTGTATNPAANSPSPGPAAAVSPKGAGSGALIAGAAAALIVVAVFVLVRRKFL